MFFLMPNPSSSEILSLGVFLAITCACQSLHATKPEGMEETLADKSQSLRRVEFVQQSYQRYGKFIWGGTFFFTYIIFYITTTILVQIWLVPSREFSVV